MISANKDLSSLLVSVVTELLCSFRCFPSDSAGVPEVRKIDR